MTVLLLAPTVVMTALLPGHPGILAAVRRDPASLQRGEWWRLLSPVLVQADPLWRTLAVFFWVLLFGAVAERVLGRVRVAALYLGGAVAGKIGGMLWQPYGAGCSVAGCGVLGGLVAWGLRAPFPPKVGAILLLLGAAVATLARDIHGPPILAGALVGALTAARRPSAPPTT